MENWEPIYFQGFICNIVSHSQYQLVFRLVQNREKKKKRFHTCWWRLMFANPTLFVAIGMMFFFCSIFSLFSHAIGFLVPSGLQRSFIGITYTFSENDSFATVGAVVTKNGSIFPIRGHDSNIVDAMLFTCCTLACLYMVRNCRKEPNRQRCGLGYWWVCVIKRILFFYVAHSLF